MSYHKELTLVLLLLILPAPAFGQQPLALQQAMAQAQNNRLYQARLQRVEALQGKVEQAGRRPNPELESKVESTVNGDDHVVSFMMSQKWERGGKRDLRRQIAEAELQQARLEAEDYMRILTSQIRLAYLDLLQLQKQTSLLQSHMDRISRMIKLDEVRVREGEIPALSLDHLVIELTRVTLLKGELEGQRTLARYQFNALIGATAETDYLLRDEEMEKVPLPSVDQAVSFASANRPDLKKLRASVEQAQHEIGMERAVGKRDWNIALGYLRERGTIHGDDVVPSGLVRSIIDTDHLLELKLTVPIPVWDDNSGNLAAAMAAKKVRESELAHAEFLIRSQVLAAYQRYELKLRLGEVYRTDLLPRLETDLQKEEAAYELTGDGLGDWLRDQGNFWEGSLQSVETDYEWRKSMVELELQLGGSLQQLMQTR